MGMGRPKASNPGMKLVNDFEARTFGELSGSAELTEDQAVEIVFLYCALW